MFNKRLLKELPEAKAMAIKQVFYQWLALCMNMIFTFILCTLFVQLYNHQLTFSFVLKMMGVIVVLLLGRGWAFRQISQTSFQSSSLVKQELRKKLFEKVLLLGNHYQDDVSTSELVQLSVEGINQLETYFALYLPQLFYSLIAPLTLFIVLSFYDFTSAFVLFVCVPLIPISIVVVQKIAKRLLSKYWDSYTSLGDSFLENLQGLTTLKIYQSDAFKQEEMNQEAESFRKMTMRVLIMQLNSISVMDIVAYGGAGLGSYFAISHMMNHSISLFTGLLIVLLSFEFFIPMRQLGSYFHIAMNGIAASEKIFKILDTEVKNQGTDSLESTDMDVQVSHLCFGYDEERQILKDISFSIKPHSFVGIVGESGSGKSTIAKLIMGYHSHYQGQISIQGHERATLDEHSFLKNCVYITHDPLIFKGTVRDNLNMAQSYSDEEMWSVLKQVRLDEFFHHQNGLDTELLESGSNLSGGQKQRLNLARSLLTQANMYIFDEATSNIDVESEEHILNVIQELAKEKTVIMITHRLSSVENCDDILVMDHGYLVEYGTHASLEAYLGVYHQLLTQQKRLEAYHHE